MISKLIGQKIKAFRKKKKLTLKELGQLINKAESTVSKYETGEISIDIATFYEIAYALEVDIQQLLVVPEHQTAVSTEIKEVSSFFKDLDRIFAYTYDGREKEIFRCILDISPFNDEGIQDVYLYMNFSNYDFYQNCETTFKGQIHHFSAVTNILLTNTDSAMESASINVLAPYQDVATKWSKFNGLSSRPIMPASSKMLLSKTILNEDQALIDLL